MIYSVKTLIDQGKNILKKYILIFGYFKRITNRKIKLLKLNKFSKETVLNSISV
jgi:flagellar biosynthesis protein FlhB